MISRGFVCDLWSGLLWQGSLTGPLEIKDLPHLHIHCAQEFQPVQTEIQRVLWCPFADGAWGGDPKVLRAVDAGVATIQSGRPVVVTCFAGINRSAFVAALILIRVAAMTGPEAIAHIRQANPPALENWHFVAYLQGLLGNNTIEV